MFNPQGFETNNSIQAIKDELACLRSNMNENQEMKDTRFAIIFQEIPNIFEVQGETIFFA